MWIIAALTGEAMSADSATERSLQTHTKAKHAMLKARKRVHE